MVLIYFSALPYPSNTEVLYARGAAAGTHYDIIKEKFLINV